MAPKSAATPSASSKEMRYFRTDLPARDKKNILEAVSTIYMRYVECKDSSLDAEDFKIIQKKSKKERWQMFAETFKNCMDKSFEPMWHIVIGENIGFACKKANNTMAIFRMDKVMIICWKSPAVEDPERELNMPDDEAKAKEEAKEAAIQAKEAKDGTAAAATPGKLKIVEPKVIEEGSSIAQAVGVLKQCRSLCSDEHDLQDLAQAVRAKLTAEMGTIWHVFTGAEFVSCPPVENVENYVHAIAGKSTHLVCYQHKQRQPRVVDYEKILKSLPYFLFMVFCFAYMGLHSVCSGQDLPDEGSVKSWMKRTFCTENWEWGIMQTGTASMAVLFVSKKAHLIFKKTTGA